MAVRETIEKANGWLAWGRVIPRWLAVVGALIVGVLLGIVGSASPGLTTALVGLVGVALGGTISATTTLLSAREARKSELAAMTWADRVKAHQEGFTLWLELKAAADGFAENRREVVNKAFLWWGKNCLYLSADASDAFLDILGVAMGESDESDKRMGRACRLLVESAGGHISDEVLRSLTELQQGAKQPHTQL